MLKESVTFGCLFASCLTFCQAPCKPDVSAPIDVKESASVFCLVGNTGEEWGAVLANSVLHDPGVEKGLSDRGSRHTEKPDNHLVTIDELAREAALQTCLRNTFSILKLVDASGERLMSSGKENNRDILPDMAVTLEACEHWAALNREALRRIEEALNRSEGLVSLELWMGAFRVRFLRVEGSGVTMQCFVGLSYWMGEAYDTAVSVRRKGPPGQGERGGQTYEVSRSEWYGREGFPGRAIFLWKLNTAK